MIAAYPTGVQVAAVDLFDFIRRKSIGACFCLPQVAVVDGYTFAHLSQRLDLAGRHITQHLMEMLIR